MAYDKTKMQDIKHSELSLLEQYNALWQNNDIAGMNTFLTEHPELKYKVLNAYNWQRSLNLVRDGETWTTGPNAKITTNATSDSLEGAFATDYNLLVDATANFKYVGNWQTGTAYKKNNLVKLDEYHTYFCLLNHTASSTNAPPNATYWVLADGIHGVVGIPVSSTAPSGMIEGDIFFKEIT